MLNKNFFKWSLLVIAAIIVIDALFLINGINNTNKEQNTESGIFENVNNQLDEDAEFTNGWRSPLVDIENAGSGKFIIVQVGSLKSDPEQGVAIVYHQNKDSEQYVIDEEFLTPGRHGAIKIESHGSKDFTMLVIAEDGYEWIFDIYNGFYNYDNGR